MRHFIITLFTLSVLAGCSAETEAPAVTDGTSAPATEPATPEPVPVPVETPVIASPYDTDFSVRTIMNTLVNPHALDIWQAVRYVVTEDGVTEDISPRTDEDWARLRESAIILVEGGNALMMPGRVVDDAPLSPDYPGFQFTPEEIQGLIETDNDGWTYYAQEMQASTRATLESIEKRDVLGLIDDGARINRSCQGCHAEFWYKPNTP